MKPGLTYWTAGMITLASVACSDGVGPDGSRRALGILQLVGDAGPNLASVAVGQSIVWSRPPGDEVTVPPNVIEAPDTVQVGEPFQMTVYTIGPDGCWFSDGLDIVQSGRVIELTPWDRHSGADFCTLALKYLPHAATLTLDQTGEWTLRVTGRRTRSDTEAGDQITAEREIFVRPPYTAEQPFEVTMGVGAEIRVDGLFRVGFVDVTEDSRCPVDVVCVWQGNAAVLLGLTLGTGPTHSFTVNTGVAPARAEHGGYGVTLVELDPTPRSEVPIERDSYRVRLRIGSLR